MKVADFVRILDADYFTGVPDSQLKALCDYLIDIYGVDGEHHIIAANEGNAVGIAVGYHLATGKVPVVYMQNSGEGNIINPLASLLNEKVYAIPCILIIGWRGEPGVHDEPQHIYQGEVTCKLLETMGVTYFIVSEDTSESEMEDRISEFRPLLAKGHSVAYIIRKNALTYNRIEYKNDNRLNREEVIRHILRVAGNDPIISTTGKISRELFDIREASGETHERDFLTVGSMGHCSSIALGVALNKPDKRIWCIEGDGSGLMHMGAIPVIAHHNPSNLVHIVINNGAHETVGGMPTVMEGISFCNIAKACGYPEAFCVNDYDMLDIELEKAAKGKCLRLIEIKCALGARTDLGRPKIPAVKCKENFMTHLQRKCFDLGKC